MSHANGKYKQSRQARLRGLARKRRRKYAERRNDPELMQLRALINEQQRTPQD